MIVILILAAGFLAGWLFRKKTSQKTLDKVIMGFIYLLLFLLGVMVGSNTEVMNHLSGIGVEALVLSLLAIGFSVLLVRVFFSRRVSKA